MKLPRQFFQQVYFSSDVRLRIALNGFAEEKCGRTVRLPDYTFILVLHNNELTDLPILINLLFYLLLRTEECQDEYEIKPAGEPLSPNSISARSVCACQTIG
jgi:hypothetical protein